MTESIPDLALEARLQLGSADDVDRAESPMMLPLFAALRCLDELLAITVAHAHAIADVDPFHGLHIVLAGLRRCWLEKNIAEERAAPAASGVPEGMKVGLVIEL
jgi:hypothetical protein